MDLRHVPRRLVLPILLLTLAAAAGVGSQDPGSDDPAALRAALLEAYRAERWERAVELGEALERVAPNQWRTRFTVACVHARAGSSDAAFEWLARAVESGFYRRRHLAEDRDLDSLRSDPRFAAVKRAVASNWEMYDAWVRERFAAAPPLVVEPKGHDPGRPTGLMVALHGHGGRPDGYPEEWARVTRRSGLLLACPASPHPLGGGFTWAGVEEAELVVDLTLAHVRGGHEVDPGRVLLTGFSQGGFIAYSLGARHPERFAGVIPMACGYQPEVDRPPPAPAGAPPFFFMVGSHDRALDGTRAAADAFREAGYRAELRVYRSTGHTFPVALVPELERALEAVLAPSGPS